MQKSNHKFDWKLVPIIIVGGAAYYITNPPEFLKNRSAIAPTASNPAHVSVVSKSTESGKPSLPECNREYQSVVKDTFDNCMLLGMSYGQVNSVFNVRGEARIQSARSATYIWKRRGNELAIGTFIDDKLVTKSQSNLGDYGI